MQAGDIHALRDFVAELGWAIPDSVATLGFDPLILDTAFEAVVDVRAMDLETVDTETALIKYGVAATAAGALAAHIASVADDLDTHLGNTFLNAAADMVTEFPKRLVDYLIVDYVEQVAPPLYRAFLVLGLFELEEFGADPATFRSAHVRRVVRFDRLPKLFTRPRRAARGGVRLGQAERGSRRAGGAPVPPACGTRSAGSARVPTGGGARARSLRRSRCRPTRRRTSCCGCRWCTRSWPACRPRLGCRSCRSRAAERRPGLALTPYAEGKLSKTSRSTRGSCGSSGCRRTWT